MIGRGEGCREGMVREFGMGMDIPLYLKRITSKGLLYSTGDSAQCYVGSLDGRRIWSCSAVRLKLSQHC